MFARSIQSIGLFVVLSLTGNNTVKKASVMGRSNPTFY